ncbi:MAG: hypothetical protein ACRCTJ_04210 [Brevinema sp.]
MYYSCVVEKADAWRAKLASRTIYNAGEVIEIDPVSGNFKIILPNDNTNYYRFDSARSDREAYYTRYTGSYVGILICDSGIHTNENGLYQGKVRVVDAISKPSQSKRNIIFKPQDLIGTFTP